MTLPPYHARATCALRGDPAPQQEQVFGCCFEGRWRLDGGASVASKLNDRIAETLEEFQAQIRRLNLFEPPRHRIDQVDFNLGRTVWQKLDTSDTRLMRAMFEQPLIVSGVANKIKAASASNYEQFIEQVRRLQRT